MQGHAHTYARPCTHLTSVYLSGEWGMALNLTEVRLTPGQFVALCLVFLDTKAFGACVCVCMRACACSGECRTRGQSSIAFCTQRVTRVTGEPPLAGKGRWEENRWLSIGSSFQGQDQEVRATFDFSCLSSSSGSWAMGNLPELTAVTLTRKMAAGRGKAEDTQRRNTSVQGSK